MPRRPWCATLRRWRSSSPRGSGASSLAHPLQPTVHVGKAGVTDAVIASVDRALLDHELIKVQMRQPEAKTAMAQRLAEATSAALCGLLGHTVILYRPHPETPTIELE